MAVHSHLDHCSLAKHISYLRVMGLRNTCTYYNVYCDMKQKEVTSGLLLFLLLNYHFLIFLQITPLIFVKQKKFK